MELHNHYYLLRHGEALHNVRNLNSSWPETFENPLTEVGVQSINEAADQLKNQTIDHIFSSDLLRTKQTAEIVAKALGLPVAYDERLREINFGSLNGKPWEGVEKEDLDKGVEGESYADVLERTKLFLEDIEKKYKNSHILIVSHQVNLWLLESFLRGETLEQAMAQKGPRIGRGELRILHGI